MVDRGTKYLSIDNALKFKSNKLSFPFIIGHDCNIPFKNDKGEDCIRNREFYAFNSVDEFLNIRYLYPHSHEMILDRATNTQDGRIAFDFDIEEHYFRSNGIIHKKDANLLIDSTGTESGYVAPSFELDIEKVIIITLKKYYEEVDIKKIRFIWLGCKNKKKFSRHLIIIGTRMKDDWATQLKSFYALFRYEAYLSNLFYYIPNIDKLIDGQLPKKCSSLRMCGSKKLVEGANPLVGMVRMKENRRLFMPDYLDVKLDRNGIPKVSDNKNLECDMVFFDTLIQNFDPNTVMKEQKIPSQRLNLSKVMKLRDDIDEEAEEEEESNNNIELEIFTKKETKKRINPLEKKRLLRNIPQLTKALEEMSKQNTNVTITDDDLDIISELDGCFEYRETKGNSIYLKRICSGPCMISGVIHDKEHAVLNVREDGMVTFYCFRGCVNSLGYPGLIIRNGNGQQIQKRQPTKEESIKYILNLQKEKTKLEEKEEEEEDNIKNEEEEELKQQMKEAMNNFRKQQKKNKERGKERRDNNKTRRIETHKEMLDGIKFKQEATDVLTSWLNRNK